jgi:hypothetical protein
VLISPTWPTPRTRRVDSFSRCPLDVEQACERVGGGLGGRGLAGANVAMEDDERVAVAERADEPGTAVVFALGPRAHAVDVSQERHLTAQASRPLNGGRQFTINTAL